jgi:sirohydrochlorin cobaltochelatase
MSRGLLLVGHGSHLDAASSAPFYAHAARMRGRSGFDDVRVATWKEEPSLSRALDGFGPEDVTVVPIFMSDGYFTSEVAPREMGLAGRVSCVQGHTVRYTAPVGSHPALARVIVQRAREAGATRETAVAVLGHGTPRNARSEANIYAQSGRVRAMDVFDEVVTVFMDQEPNMRQLLDLVRAETVVVVPLFVADGWHVGSTIPEELALDGPETRRGGRHLRYATAVGTHPMVADVISELAEEARPW